MKIVGAVLMKHGNVAVLMQKSQYIALHSGKECTNRV